jgi:pilus assembly protein TadC
MKKKTASAPVKKPKFHPPQFRKPKRTLEAPAKKPELQTPQSQKPEKTVKTPAKRFQFHTPHFHKPDFGKLAAKLNSMKEWWRKKKEEVERRKAVEHDIKSRLAQKKKQRTRYKLKPYLEQAGMHVDSKKLTKVFFNFCIAVNLLISGYLIYYYATNFGFSVSYVVFTMALVWTVIFIGLLFLIWLLFHVVLDLRIFERRVAIEEVLPDYLQLTSANIRAGMPIDRALWLAVRPRFGVLAKEIEMVAKQTMSGEELEKALQNFADKYDSQILKRSVNLLIEGINAGGEIGDLLNKISINIKESQLLRKEMSANVTTYVIFIGFATMIAAPFLFGLSYQLLNNITTIMASVEMPAGQNVMGMSLGGAVGISLNDFKIFAYTSLLVTSFFSAVLVASIKKGDVKAGVKYIPVFMITAVVVFRIAISIMGKVFGNLF